MYNVVIVGAGYAGSRLSGLLCDLDDVLVIDEKGVGKKDVSAATFSKILEDSVIRREYDEYVIMTVFGERYSYEFNEPVMALVDYERLCKNEISHDILKTRVTEYGDGFVKTEDGEVIKAKAIVDCTGVYGFDLRKKYGFGSPPFTISLSFTEIKNPEFLNSKAMYFIMGYTNFGGWIYPVSDSHSEFGFAVRHNGIHKNYPKIGEAAEVMGIGLPENDELRYAQYTFGFVKRVVKGRVVLFGDSCGLVHPAYMMGIHYIHKISGKLAHHIRNYVSGDYKSLDRYQRFWIETLKRASGNIAKGYAVWDLPVNDQLRVTRVQIRSKIKPSSILDHMWSLDESFDVLAMNPPGFFDYPLKVYLNYFKHKILMKFL